MVNVEFGSISTCVVVAVGIMVMVVVMSERHDSLLSSDKYDSVVVIDIKLCSKLIYLLPPKS